MELLPISNIIPVEYIGNFKYILSFVRGTLTEGKSFEVGYLANWDTAKIMKKMFKNS